MLMKSAQDLHKIANELRIEVLQMVHRAGAGHIAGPLSSAEIFTVLYLGGCTRIEPERPDWEERDRIVNSAGHYCPMHYAALAKAGFFEESWLVGFGKTGSKLGVHPEKIVGEETLAGIEVSSGPLGQGVSVAVGMALALKLKYGELPQTETPRVYCIMSDGELQEGQVWEAVMTAVRRQLDNLIIIIDRNRVQIERYISEVVGAGEIVAKMEAFGTTVYQCDGNSVEELQSVITKAKFVKGGPAVIVAETVAAKGVSFMENTPKWHDQVPSDEELARAVMELRHV